LLLTIVTGAVLGLAIVPELGWAGAALIASVLAPTDAALGMAVVSDRAVPVRIRRALNIESGLNDGIATPFVTVFLAALLSEEGLEGGSWVAEAAIELGLAIVVAIVVGGLGGRLLRLAAERGWTSGASEQFFVLVVAILAYVGAVEVGGNGFVSAFSAGLVFGAAGGAQRRESIVFTEDLSLFASFVVWVIFGASFVGPVLTGPVDASFIVYALLSLTVVRMAPVAIALIGKGFGARTVGFMGWFGPRGLASVVFTLLAVEELAGSSVDLPLFEVATWTILLSVILHGLSARPLAAAYGAGIAARDPSVPELVDVPEPRLSRRHLKS
jgi:NhaP-type Na+/H+ or K+/H+ antiporter